MNPPSLTTKRRIRRIAPLQAGKILGILYAALGLVFIPFFLFIGAMASQVPADQRAGMMFMSGGFALFAPIMYGVLGFLFGVIGAAIYNLVAGWVGGFEVDVEQLT